jgi:hypothetical protein
MAVKNSVAAIPQVSFDTNNLTANYQLVNPAGLPKACFLLRLINTSVVDVIISYDGIAGAGNDTILARSISVYPFQTNSQPNNNMALIPVGTKIWVKQRTGAGGGSLVIAGYYQQ